jgi:hypothetical protein
MHFYCLSCVHFSSIIHQLLQPQFLSFVCFGPVLDDANLRSFSTQSSRLDLFILVSLLVSSIRPSLRLHLNLRPAWLLLRNQTSPVLHMQTAIPHLAASLEKKSPITLEVRQAHAPAPSRQWLNPVLCRLASEQTVVPSRGS